GTMAPATAPTISGTLTYTNTLTAAHGTWSPAADTYAYQWQVSADGVSGWTNATGTGATTSSYAIAPADVGKHLRVHVTASKAAYSDSTQDSAATTAILAATFTNSTAPTVSGTAQVGTQLTSTNGTWSQTPDSFTYQCLE